MDEIRAIVLAAGASTRMGKQKLLLPFNRRTIIETVIGNVISVLKNEIFVVLGSHRETIKQQIDYLPVHICINENYPDGMLSSVICGFRSLPEETQAVLIFLGDQPQITPLATRKVIQAWQQSGKGIVIPTFHGRRGHPTLIETKYKSKIEQLDLNKGLRELMIQYKNDICEVECKIPEILRDIDTPEDYEYETKSELIKNRS